MSASPVRIGLVVGVLVAGGGLGWWSLDNLVLSEMERLHGEIEQAERRIEYRERQASTLKRDASAIQEIASRTIAGAPEEGVHRLRLALTAVADSAGLGDVSVTSRYAGGSVNPGAGELSVLEGLKDVPDFDVIAGSLSGRGGVNEVVRALALLDAQPWPRQVCRVSLSPEEGGSVVRLAIDVQTMVLQDLPPGSFSAEPTPIDSEREALVERLSARNVFAPPPPPAKRETPVAAEPDEPQPPKPAPPPPPYGDWRVSGVVEAGEASELWLTHANSGQTLILTVGQSHLDAVFTGLSGGMAIISIGGDRFALAPGETLAARDRPVPVQ